MPRRRPTQPLVRSSGVRVNGVPSLNDAVVEAFKSDDEVMIGSVAALQDGQAVRLVFADGSRGARIDGESEGGPPPVRPKPLPPRPKAPPTGQGDLF